MPKRTDIKSILIIGAGPIVIGQACEFDYSGTQACKALKAEGYRVVLVNSNPATIMTDPDLADATYIEPITPEIVAKIIEKERPDALLPTMGGQTALNCALSLRKMGVLDKFGVTMIGATADAIDMAEDRALFREAMTRIGLETPRSRLANASELKKADREKYRAETQRINGLQTLEADRAQLLKEFEQEWARGEPARRERYQDQALIEALQALEFVGLPAIIRPSFTLGGTGGGIAYTKSEFLEIVEGGLDASPTNEVLIEESVLGWKEFEMEVVRDKKDNCIIICSIENFDPMGVHTGDSITIAPALTLTDKEYQIMRDASIAVLREIGVETGGSNVQFAVNPADGRLVIIEMNPRVSRSSALASKATGFPIAKVAAKLAVGYTLDEIANDITGGATPASFEPTIDYVVTKIPRFAFEKFPGASPVLTTSMKSVGEAMAIGRTFQESLQKALRSLETGLTGLDEITIEGFDPAKGIDDADNKAAIRAALGTPTPDRLLTIAQAMRVGANDELIHNACRVDPWFLGEIRAIVETETEIKAKGLPGTAGAFRRLKAKGFSDKRLGKLTGAGADEVMEKRRALGVRPVFKRIDTCAAEFASPTAYMYSTYETPFAGTVVDEAAPSDKKKVIILGGGPNRIGQGIEFDYCCCHAAFALKEVGYETIMVNCNPETVSTDYDTSDRLYFEPLTPEDVLEIIDTERTNGTLHGVIVQFGGQTPLKLAEPLEKAKVPILGTSPDMIDLAEDRDRFKKLLDKLKVRQPQNGIATSLGAARAIADEIGYPVVIRPSNVLGGRAMEIVRDAAQFDRYVAKSCERSRPAGRARGFQTKPAADRPLSVGCNGSGRRLPVRRQGHLHRRHHGAHRGSRHPFRRLGLRAAAAFIKREDHRRARPADPRAGARAQCRRADERAIRHQGRRHLRAGGQSARLAHGALRRQGDRPAGGQDRRPHHGGREPGELQSGAEPLQAPRRQGSGVPVRALPRRRHRAGAGDEIDRRGDGDRRLLRDRLRQEPDRRRRQPAALGHGIRLGQGRRQTAHPGCRAAARLARLQDHRHLGNPALPRRTRGAGGQGVQGAGRPAPYRGCHQKRRCSAGFQYHRGDGGAGR